MTREIYTYKDKTYVILGSTSMKDPSSRKWLEAINYMQLETGFNATREKEEFFRLFKLVE